jgi:ABC-type sugar transport system ATPase subunit
MPASHYALEARGLRKSYGGIKALQGIDFRVYAGSVHALVGENGAGKSTLVKVLVGAVLPDEGLLHLDGREVRFTSTADAAVHGVAIVSQELNLFPDLDVLSNLFLMREARSGPFIQRKPMLAQAKAVLRELGLEVDLRTPVEELSLEQRQLLEIARALLLHPRVLILDEPTSALNARATERLHHVLRALRQRSVAVVYISHMLEDVLSLCDEVTVLRDGKNVLDARPVAELALDEIVRAMLGDKALAQEQAYTPASRQSRSESRKALRLEQISVAGMLENVTLEARAGAIIGVAGLSGSGHREALAVAAGLLPASKGRVLLPDGSALRPPLQKAVRQGVAFVSGDRRRLGLMLEKTIWENIAQVRSVVLGRDGHFLPASRLRTRASAQVQRLGIKTPSVDQEAGFLSGGNQQKVVFARWLAADPAVFLFDDPTRGIDVGARAELYKLMRELAEQERVQILASTDLRELATVCDQVFVFYKGRICAVLKPPLLDAHTLLEVMNTGALPASAASSPE